MDVTPHLKPRKRLIDKDYIAHVAQHPCLRCGCPSGPPHHVRAYGWAGMSRKPDDYYTVPICAACHDLLHNDPKQFEAVDLLLSIIEMLIGWITRRRGEHDYES